ncbi:MAG: glycine zipper domain-containing protein, partial [Rhizomicrobium sp.]
MLKKSTMMIAAAALAVGISGTGAFADECSGRDHTGGTVLGALGGGLLGGLASHGNGLGIVGGALLGGLAGNAISRDMDCDDRPYAARS